MLGQQFLQRRSWRDEGLREGGPVARPSLAAKPIRCTLPVGPFGISSDDEHLARDLEVGDAPDGELTNVFRRRRSVGPQHDRRRDILPQRGMRDGKCHGLCHRWMLQQHFFDFLRGDFLPAAIDDLADAASEKQVPVVIEEADIPVLNQSPANAAWSPGSPS